MFFDVLRVILRVMGWYSNGEFFFSRGSWRRRRAECLTRWLTAYNRVRSHQVQRNRAVAEVHRVSRCGRSLTSESIRDKKYRVIWVDGQDPRELVHWFPEDQ